MYVCLLICYFTKKHVGIYVYIWPCATQEVHKGIPQDAQVQDKSADISAYIYINILQIYLQIYLQAYSVSV